MRHGTSYWNEKGITQGRSNNKLSHFGIELTEKVALNNKNSVFDVIFTSIFAKGKNCPPEDIFCYKKYQLKTPHFLK